jgi:hypothetical protein
MIFQQISYILSTLSNQYTISGTDFSLQIENIIPSSFSIIALRNGNEGHGNENSPFCLINLYLIYVPT